MSELALSPPAAAAPPRPSIPQIARAFLTPRRPPAAPAPLQLPAGRRVFFDTPEGRIAAIDAGDGPLVLLQHGWEGAASDMAALAHDLLEAGARVLVPDLPAHGESAGDHTSIPAAARALLAVQRQLGPLRAVVAHSVGAAVAVEAMAQGLHAGRIALIGAPARYVDYARGFAAQAGLDAEQTQQMIAALRDLGVDVGAVSLPRRAAGLFQPALFVHSRDDRVVALRDAQASSGAWAGSTLLEVDGLGHRRILFDAAITQAVTQFVLGPPM